MAKEKPKYATLGECVKALCEKADLTVAEAAAQSGIEEESWADLEANLKSTTVVFLWKIAGVLGVRPSELLE